LLGKQSINYIWNETNQYHTEHDDNLQSTKPKHPSKLTQTARLSVSYRSQHKVKTEFTVKMDKPSDGAFIKILYIIVTHKKNPSTESNECVCGYFLKAQPVTISTDFPIYMQLPYFYIS
jgi:hypothetical protein